MKNNILILTQNRLKLNFQGLDCSQNAFKTVRSLCLENDKIRNEPNQMIEVGVKSVSTSFYRFWNVKFCSKVKNLGIYPAMTLRCLKRV